MNRFLLPAPLILVGVFSTYMLIVADADAQSGSRIYPASPNYPAAPRKSFEARFWDYLKGAKYTNWAPGPGQNGDFYEGSSPHGAHLKMYLNRTAVANSQELPHGSIVIKENYGEDKKALMAITVMYRVKGYNAEGGDWYWIKYNANGTVATAPPDKGGMQLSGKVKGCISCHGGAEGEDFAFVND